MLSYKEQNVNPKRHKTGDCSTRALTTVLNLTYQDVLKLQCEESCKHCYGITDKQTIGAIAEAHGWVKMKQPKKEDGKKY